MKDLWDSGFLMKEKCLFFVSILKTNILQHNMLFIETKNSILLDTGPRYHGLPDNISRLYLGGLRF